MIHKLIKGGIVTAALVIGTAFVSLASQTHEIDGTYIKGEDDLGVYLSHSFFADAGTSPENADQIQPSDFKIEINSDSLTYQFTIREKVYQENLFFEGIDPLQNYIFILNSQNKSGSMKFNVLSDKMFNGALSFHDYVTGQDYWIDIGSLTKQPIGEMHTVTVVTRYTDDARPQHSATYQVNHGAAFSASFEVLDGYDIYNTMLRQQLAFDVDMDSKTVSLTPVEKDYVIELEFDKAEYRTRLTTSYQDQSHDDVTQTDWTRHGETYSKTFTIADGYHITNIDQLPQGVQVDERNNTVTIDHVTQDYDVVLILAKTYYFVNIQIVYEDDTHDPTIIRQEVLHGDSFYTDFPIEQGYAIKKVNFNAAGVTVNKSEQFISIDQVTDSIDIVIYVR